MPTNIFGEWIAPPEQKTAKKLVKVSLVKRGNKVVTHILNLDRSAEELESLASSLKKQLGSGGSIKGSDIEIQGDKVTQVQSWLRLMGIKSS